MRAMETTLGKLPRSWADVTLRGWHALVSIPDSVQGEERSYACAAAVIGCSEDDLRRSPSREWGTIVEALQFTNRQPRQRFSERITLADGTVLRFRGDAEWSLGQTIDLSEDCAAWPGSMVTALARVYRPEGEEDYDGSTVEARAGMLADAMTAEEARGAAVFFSLAGSASLTSTLRSSLGEG